MWISPYVSPTDSLYAAEEVFHTILRATAKDSGLILDKKPSRCAIL